MLAACELLSNLSLADQIQQRANESKLKPELRLFFAILTAVTVATDDSYTLLKHADKVKVAILGLLANLVGHEELIVANFPANASTTVFMAMASNLK